MVQADLKIRPEPTSLRFVQDAFGNYVGIAQFSRRSKELSFESTVCLKHSPCETAFDLEHAGRAFPVGYSVGELRDLAQYIERHQLDPMDDVGRWARQFLPPIGAIGTFELLTRLSQGIHHGFLLQAAGSEGNPAASGDAPARPWELPRLRHADDRGGALVWSRRAVCVGVSGRPAGRSAGAGEHGSARGSKPGSPRRRYSLPGAGWMDFDPTNGSVGNTGVVTVAVVPDPRHAIPLHGTFIGFPSDHLGMEVQVRVASGMPA